ncbi:MAG TPA: hypothetical protein VFT59_02785 [Candidatus Saccharimonadales bacterium]|nr:hypothetical protein [Candidatus Saccharimonadales bacterium]
MRERSPNILIMGAGASQGIFGEHFVTPEITEAEGVNPRITFYDPNPASKIKENLPYLMAAAKRDDVRITHTMPYDEFDVAVIASASGHHAEAVEATLETQDAPPLFILEKPLAASWQELDHFHRLEPWVQPTSITNEPFYFSRGMNVLLDLATQQEDNHNKVTEIRVWSSKKRRLSKDNPPRPHGMLGPFGVELPHLHGGASLLAGETLGLQSDAVTENVYFSDVNAEPYNDGNRLRFRSGEKTVYVAQGLGSFAMDGYGNMQPNDNPPHIKRASVRFEDGQYVELDLNTAFPPAHTGKHGFSTLWQFDAHGNLVGEHHIQDDPRRELAHYVLRCVRDTVSPSIPHVSMSESLQRSEALLRLREGAVTQRNITL